MKKFICDICNKDSKKVVEIRDIFQHKDIKEFCVKCGEEVNLYYFDLKEQYRKQTNMLTKDYIRVLKNSKQ